MILLDLGIKRPGVERRRSGRFPVAGIVYYSDPTVGGREYALDTPHLGLANDMCADGAGILTKHRFCEGEYIRVTFEGFGKLTVTGTIRWCRRCTEHLYRVGINIPSFF